MASKSLTSLVLFLAVNLLFFNLTAATHPVAPKSCPRDSLKIKACANVLNLVKVKIPAGTGLEPCCPLINGLVDLDAAVCLCTSLKVNLLNIPINIPVDLSLAINNACGSKIPAGFQCPKQQTDV